MSKAGESRDAKGAGLYCEVDGSPVTLLAEDLTTAGFFVQTTTPKAMDRELKIFVRSSVGELFARGQVVQVVDAKRARAENRRPGYGLLFTSLEDDQRAFIGLTLDAHERLQRAQAKAEQDAKAEQEAKAAREAELKVIMGELRAELTKLSGKTAWTALGLDADAPLEGAKEAFLRMSKRFHPHKFARHNSVEVTKLATEVFIAYKRAYTTLTKLAPRVSATSLHEAQRGARSTMTSIAPVAAAASIRPDTTKPAGNRSRSR